MSEFIPTCHLRVYCELESHPSGDGLVERKRLQQRWDRAVYPRDDLDMNDHEWRDIPEYKSYD